jgi:hypothetical protein
MFRSMDPLMQRLRRIIVHHRNRLLSDDRPGVNSGIHKMHGAASDLYAMIQRLFPGLQSGE